VTVKTLFTWHADFAGMCVAPVTLLEYSNGGEDGRNRQHHYQLSRRVLGLDDSEHLGGNMIVSHSPSRRATRRQ
jgi:hypothetical protein